jgi:hypothetical protein
MAQRLQRAAVLGPLTAIDDGPVSHSSGAIRQQTASCCWSRFTAVDQIAMARTEQSQAAVLVTHRHRRRPSSQSAVVQTATEAAAGVAYGRRSNSSNGAADRVTASCRLSRSPPSTTAQSNSRGHRQQPQAAGWIAYYRDQQPRGIVTVSCYLSRHRHRRRPSQIAGVPDSNRKLLLESPWPSIK